MDLQHITNIDPYFKHQDGKLIFTGNELIVKISRRWETYNHLDITDSVKSLGIMDMIINEQFNAHLHLIASITMKPTVIDYETINDKKYVVLTFYNGDIFLDNISVVKTQSFIYILFNEYINYGQTIYTMKYPNLLTLFDTAKEICGASLSTDHAIFEVIYAHISRSEKEPSKFYRHTDMDPDDFLQIPLSNFALSTDSTTAKLTGSYLRDTLISAVNFKEVETPLFEDLLRGNYISEEEE